MKQFLKIYLLLFFTSLILCSCEVDNKKQQPFVKSGILDLTNWDFSKDGPVKLDGEWEFYWNQLLQPNDFATKDIWDEDIGSEDELPSEERPRRRIA